MTAARTLPTVTVEKVWGRETLPPPFATQGGSRIGEIWFEPPLEMPELLVKYLFTSENLSVQVHPSDDRAPAGSRGKEECWLVLTAEPGAKLAIGFRDAVSPDAMRAAALDGSIEDLLEWHDVAPGDFVYLPAGTVHAIGAGLSLIEVQQNSDVTYRLYDYGRPRELHLADGIAVASGDPHPPALRRSVPTNGEVLLVEGPHFRLDRLDGPPGEAAQARYGNRGVLVVPVDGSVEIEGKRIAAGECGYAPRLADVAFERDVRVLIAQPV